MTTSTGGVWASGGSWLQPASNKATARIVSDLKVDAIENMTCSNESMTNDGSTNDERMSKLECPNACGQSRWCDRHSSLIIHASFGIRVSPFVIWDGCPEFCIPSDSSSQITS